MQTIKWLINNFISIVVVVLCIIILLQRCNEKVIDNKPVVIKDTVWVIKDSLVFTKPIFIKGERDTILEKTIEYLPDANYEGLLAQFNELKQELLSKNYFKDSLKLDSFGWVKVKDTIQKNTITGRSWEYNIKYPEVTTVITKPPKLTRQLFIGGEIGGNKLKPIDNIGASLLYKDRKDRIFGIGVNKTLNEQPLTYNLKSYWKIKLKK